MAPVKPPPPPPLPPQSPPPSMSNFPNVERDGATPTFRLPEEITLIRAMHSCNSVGREMDDAWRYKAYVSKIEELLTYIRKAAHRPPQEVINEYAKNLKFLQNILFADDLPNTSNKNIFYPNKGNTKQTELHHRRKITYHKKCTEELLNNEPKKYVSLRILADIKPKKKVIKEEKNDQQKQDQLIEDMLHYINDIKESAIFVQKVTKDDVMKLQYATTITEMNYTNLHKETSLLGTYLDKAFSYWMWIIVVVVILSFIYMVIFIRLFKKPILTNY